jgi:DNA-binding NarL/FixJ family response regulator
MISRWPVLTRKPELRRALQALQRGSQCLGVLLVGEVGIGKTTLADALVETLESGGMTVRLVLGTETGQAVPLGAFHRSLSIDCAYEPAVVLAPAHRELAQQENLVIVVDDAHLLDPLSAQLVCQLADSGTAKLIVTMRLDATAPDAVAPLLTDGYLVRLDIRPLSRAQTAELACTALGGAVERVAIDLLHQWAGGNPLLLRGLLTAAVEDRVFVESAGLWRLQGPLRIGADVSDLLESRLQSLPADELEVVEFVGAAEVLDSEILRSLCNTDAIERAEHRGLVQFVADGSHTLARLEHPLLGEVARKHGGPAHSRQLNTSLAQHLSKAFRARTQGPGHTAPDVRTGIELAQFMMSSDMPPELDVITHAAANAVTMANMLLAEQLARFAYDRGGGLPAVIALADAVSCQGRGEEAEALFMAFDPAGADELTTVHWGCSRAANLFWACGKIDAAKAVLDEVRGRIDSTQILSLITAMEVAFAFCANDLQAAIADGLSALMSDMMPIATVWTVMSTAAALALAGRFAEVPAVAEQGLQASGVCEAGPQRLTIGLAEVFALTTAGDLTAADHVRRRYSAMTSGLQPAVSTVNVLVGWVELVRGRLDAACEAFESSLSAGAEAFPPGLVMLVAAWHAQAEAARGNAEAVATALARAEAAAGPQVAVFMPELDLARAWQRAAVGETTAARTYAVRAAETARRSGMYAVEMGALHTAVRFGDRSQSGRLRELASLLGGSLAAAVATHSRGLADHDGNRLDEAADQFTAIGAMALAADAAAQAAREHARAGVHTKELESSMRAHWLASQRGLRTPATTAIEDPLPITEREHAIGTLVAAGLSDREISDRLELSVRTIEEHLYRMFAALGIGDREELGRLLRAHARQVTPETVFRAKLE